jgi:glycosyltransferase involved in cell wall biosynthesis
LRILIVHNYYSQAGGEDSVVANEMALLQRAGHEVALLRFDNKAFGSPLRKLQMAATSIHNPWAQKQLAAAIAQFYPEVIHIHNLFYVASPAILATARRLAVPVVMTLHNYRLLCINAQLLRDKKPCELCVHSTFPWAGLRHRCFGHSYFKSLQVGLITATHKRLGTWQQGVARYLCLTPFARAKILDSSLQLNPEQVLLKPNFVEDRGFALPEEREDFYLFVGRLSEEKGIETLLQAFAHLPYPLKIAGAGECEDKVRAFAEKHPQLSYLGALPAEAIAALLKKCRALIFPSIWYEGLPMTILEAFAAATPVIASDMPNIRDIVLHGYNGLNFAAASPESLCRELRYFEDTRRELGVLYKQARRTYEDYYSPAKNLEMLENIYKEVIEKAPAKQV